MAHRRTASQRRMQSFTFPPKSPMDPIPATPPASPSPLPVNVFSTMSKGSSPHGGLLDSLAASSRPTQRRTTTLALLALLALGAYIFLAATPSGSSLSSFASIPLAPRPAAPNAGDPLASAWRLAKHKKVDWKKVAAAQQASDTQPQLALDPAQEFAALTSFLAALPENHIPPTVDPARPIDPSLVLDFDTRSPRASEELAEVVRDVWTRNPVVLYSKFHSSVSREIKAMLSDMFLKPSATVIDVDMRADSAVLEALLLRLTGTSALPVLVIGGHPIGDIDLVRSLNADGTLRKMIAGAGAHPDGARKKKHGRS